MDLQKFVDLVIRPTREKYDDSSDLETVLHQNGKVYKFHRFEVKNKE